MANKPDYNVCIGGEEYSKNPSRRVWTKIGVAWKSDSSDTIKLQISFPAHIIIDSSTVINLFDAKRKEEES